MRTINFYLLVSLFMVLIASCKEENIMLYNGKNYIQFVKSLSDSTTFSFLANPGKTEVSYPIPLQLIGKPESKDRMFKMEVNEKFTTATSAHYALPATFVLRANKTIDTAWITLKKSPDLAIKPVKLVLNLIPSTALDIGQTEHSIAIIYISNVIAQPEWWNDNVTDRFLGDYSDKKYLLFIQVTGRADMNSGNEQELRTYTILFKNYLLKEKDQGRIVYEENGAEMTVALTGG